MYEFVKDALTGVAKLNQFKKQNDSKRIKEKAIEFFKQKTIPCTTKDFYRLIYKDDKAYINRITEINEILSDLELQGVLHNIKIDGSTIETMMWRYIGPRA